MVRKCIAGRVFWDHAESFVRQWPGKGPTFLHVCELHWSLCVKKTYYYACTSSSTIHNSFEEFRYNHLLWGDQAIYIYIFRYIDSFEELQYYIPVVLIFQQHFLNLPIHALSTCCILRLDHFKLWCVAPQAESVSVEVISNISTFLHNSFWDWLRLRLHWLAYQFQMCELIHFNFFPMDSSDELFTSNRPSMDSSE